MTSSESVEVLVAALDLPAGSRVDRRVPKKLLVEQGAPTAGDRRRIQEGIEELLWIAALKPTNVGVPAFRDDVREYLEIAVVAATLRPTARPARLVELIHRAIPYPVVLATLHLDALTLSLVHKRWSQGETGKVVLEELRCAPPLRMAALTAEETSFLASLAISVLPRRDLFALYQGWLDRLVALEVARITGTFEPPGSGERAIVLREGASAYCRIVGEIAALRGRAAKERQLSCRVELNLEIQRLEVQRSQVTAQLQDRRES